MPTPSTNRPSKVIGVGMHKTGTTSLANALRTLGYRVTGTFGVDDPRISDTAVARGLEILQDYDAAQDNPWPFIYRDIDTAFPGSKFILTTRDEGDWIDSVRRHFGGKSTPMREWIYGAGDPIGNEERYLDVYRRHHREVIDYFSDRPGDLMELRISEGEGWPKLCEFLGVETPDRPFPHANSRQQRHLSRSLKRRLSRLLAAN